MLILSRKSGESISFPNIGITVSVLRASKGITRIGINAPPEIKVFRKELLDGSTEDTFDVENFERALGSTREEMHMLRNQLNALNLGLQFYRQQMDAGMTKDADKTFEIVLSQLRKIEEHVSMRADESEIESFKNEFGDEGTGLSVLLVEDDIAQRELLAGVLEMHGCEVVTACNGNEALSYLESVVWPDFVLLDMRMSGGDGAMTVKKLRKANSSPRLRIVATSGASPSDYGIVEGAEGVDRWFPKPLDISGLISYLREDESETPVSV